MIRQYAYERMLSRIIFGVDNPLLQSKCIKYLLPRIALAGEHVGQVSSGHAEIVSHLALCRSVDPAANDFQNLC